MSSSLTEETLAVLHESEEERIAYISLNRWIEYPLAQDILGKIDNLFKYEKGKSRISSILLVGASNNGKTTLLERFMELHPPYDFVIDDNRPDTINGEFFESYSGIGMPVLYTIAPSEPSETRLYNNILNQINVPYKAGDTVSKKQFLVERWFRLLQVEMLVIDEIHNILSGSVARQKQILNAIKNLSNTLKIPIVLAGTKDSLRAVGSDDQISSRFRPEYLTRWKMDKTFVSLLATIMRFIPLQKESDILNKECASEILEASNGYIGEIINLIRTAAIYAINTGSERITLKEIKECPYNSLSRVHKTMHLKDI